MSFRWQIGDGAKILFWFDSWFEGKELWKEVAHIDRRYNSITLNQVLKGDGTWDFSILYTTVLSTIVHHLTHSGI